jgi:AraC-like DNA-binding protein
MEILATTVPTFARLPFAMRRHASRLVPIFLRGLRAAGGDDRKLCQAFSLPIDSCEQKTVEVTTATERALAEAAAIEADDPFFGLHVASRLPRGSWGVVEYVASTAPTVGEGLRWTLGPSALVGEVTEISISERAGTAVLEHRIRGERAGLGVQGNEFVLAMIVGIGRGALGQFAPTRVWFSHRRSGALAPLTEFFGTNQIEFGQPTNGFSWPSQLLKAPMRTGDPVLYEILAGRERDQAHSPSTDFASRVRLALKRSLEARQPDIEHVATGLRMSPRTLQRRLEKDGLSFQSLLDEARATLSRALLEDSRLPLGEIAYRLGYDRSSSFVRAFRRWTGSTPAAWRKSHA